MLYAFITIGMDDVIFKDINCPCFILSDEGAMGGLLFSNYSAWSIGHCHSVQENDSICQITTLKDDRWLSNPFVHTYCLSFNYGRSQGPTVFFHMVYMKLNWSLSRLDRVPQPFLTLSQACLSPWLAYSVKYLNFSSSHHSNSTPH